MEYSLVPLSQEVASEKLEISVKLSPIVIHISEVTVNGVKNGLFFRHFSVFRKYLDSQIY